MYLLTALRIILLAVAAFGYLANGAQAHLKISKGESLSLMLCSTDSVRTVQMKLPAEPIEEKADTCCGDCATPAAIAPPRIVQPVHAIAFNPPTPLNLPEVVSPRSPLWPGAPPQGPPNALKPTV